MATVYCYVRGTIHIDYLQKRKSITDDPEFMSQNITEDASSYGRND